MDRVELEFRMDASIVRADLDQLDYFFQHKRWLKQKEKALLRDWHREKKELKEKTVAIIETQIEEQSQKLKAEYEAMKMNRVKSEKHSNLEELRVDYQQKIEIIEEIKREKEFRLKQQQMKKEMKSKEHGEEIKEQAEKFKVDKKVERS